MEEKIDKLYNVLDTILELEDASQEEIFARIADAYPQLSAEFISFCMKTFEKLKTTQ